jgi:hypothetical protein
MPLPILEARKTRCKAVLVMKGSVEGLTRGSKKSLPHRLKGPCDVQGRHGRVNDVPLAQGPARFAARAKERVDDHNIWIDCIDDVFAAVDDSDVCYTVNIFSVRSAFKLQVA